MSWESYRDIVGEQGHYYHKAVIFPKLLELLKGEKIDSWLDLGCGNGVLSNYLPKVDYVGVDSCKELLPKKKNFFLADVSKKLPLEKNDFSHGSFILSLQNIEHGASAIKVASSHLRTGGKIYIVLNHPAFRIPRQSEWGYDERSKLQYRRMNGYLKPLKIPIQMHPGKSKAVTYSYHHPLSDYSHWFQEASLRIVSIEEWISDKKSEGARAKAEDRARVEFPLFLTFVAEKRVEE